MARNVVSVDNMEVDKSKGNVMISVNPKVYGLDTIFSAAYIFLDRAYVLVDGDPNEEIIVQLRGKDKKMDLEKLGREFNNELVNYFFYAVQSARSMPIRAALVQKAFNVQSEKPVVEEMIQPRKERRRKVGKSKGGKRRSKHKR